MCIRVCSALASTEQNYSLDAKTRAIANVLGVSKDTVARQIKTSPVADETGDAKPPNHLLAQMFH